MHEVNIAKRIIEEAKKLGAKNSLTVEVGELCDFFPAEIKETLERLTNWKVSVKEGKSYVECSCGYRGRAKILTKEHGFVLYVCPKCNSKPKVVEGNDVKIISVG